MLKEGRREERRCSTDRKDSSAGAMRLGMRFSYGRVKHKRKRGKPREKKWGKRRAGKNVALTS